MPAGRPSSVTPEVRKNILLAIRAGNYREVAAQFAGITGKTLREYLKRKDSDAIEFRAAIQRAESEVEIEMVGAIKRLGTGDFKAATWYLTHKFPERWSDKSKELKEAIKLLRKLTNAEPDGSGH